MPSNRSVRIEKAQLVLRPGVPAASGGVWADLGCGDGIFTAALYTLLGPDSAIFAVDKSQRALHHLERHFETDYPGAKVHTVPADFDRELTLPSLDGVVMANSLHFVRRKAPIVSHFAALLKPKGRFIVVEYNVSHSNLYVPYPLNESAFLEIARAAGLRRERIIARIASSFLGEMYAGIAFAGKASSAPQ